MHQKKIGKNVKTSNLRLTLFETDFEIQTWLNALSDFFAIHYSFSIKQTDTIYMDNSLYII